jgi:hypothetical protein
MKTKLSVLLVFLLAPFASAQVSLNDFSTFATPDTFFVGDWEQHGDPSGSNSPRSTFSQGSGVYNFLGGSGDGDSAYATDFFETPLNLTGLTQLQISVKILAGNTAPTLKIILFDGSYVTNEVALFSTSSFTSAFTTLTAALTFTSGFDASQVSAFQLSGNASGGSSILSFSLDSLTAVAPRVLTPVPESSTYGALGAVALLALIGVGRFRSTVRRS